MVMNVIKYAPSLMFVFTHQFYHAFPYSKNVLLSKKKMSEPEINDPICPHCQRKMGNLDPKEINCGIFRCGRYKDSHEPLPPHSSEEMITQLLKESKIDDGCGQPVEIHFIDGQFQTRACDWTKMHSD
jgi:hypothetical protein